MCGIAGLWHPDGVQRPQSLAHALLAGLAHRGPDGEGVLAIDGAGSIAVFRDASAIPEDRAWTWLLLHRRLSIVDISGGAQPMANESGRVWVVLNGEIYNHQDLRQELGALGHEFRTRADTEVLVHGWEEWGQNLFGRLNGMFAFALLDGRGATPEVWLARDPVGVKPLYVGRSGGLWWFASELAPVRRCGLLSDGICEEAVGEFLVYRFVPSPATLYRNAWKVPPGHSCRFGAGGEAPRFQLYQTHLLKQALPSSRTEWQEAIRQGLRRAVQRQLMADVPVGSLLSGGIDSTIVTGLMSETLASAPQSFGIGFDDDETGELGAARQAAHALQVPLVEVAVDERDYLEAWPRQISAVGEPIANSSMLFVQLLCREVGRTHKVVLTGQGADEPLGGYPRHVAERFSTLGRFLRSVWKLVPENALSSDRVARLQRISRSLDEGRRFAETLAVFGLEDASRMTRAPIDATALQSPVDRWLASENGEDSLNRLLFVDARLSLADDLLIVADHASMASSVELRVPFLDLELLGLIERLPSRWKVSWFGSRKWLYRRAVRRLLPPAIRASVTGVRARMGRKLGFTTPLDRWFARWALESAEEYLLGSSACLPALLKPDPLRALIAAARDQGRRRSRQLMSLFVLETWLRGAL